MMKRTAIITAALALIVSTGARAQQSETVTLPFAFCGQTQWQAVETSIQLDDEEEERLAYELQGFRSNNAVQRSGKVYYVPQDLDDRTMLVLKEVNISETHPYIVDNQTNKTFILQIEGPTRLSCLASVIRSKGPVMIFGPAADSMLGEVHRLTVSTRGRAGRAAIEARGDVYMQDLRLELTNRASYAIRSVGDGKEPAVLTLNHVVGTVSGQPSATAGFDVVEGHDSDVEGVEVTDIEEEEDF